MKKLFAILLAMAMLLAAGCQSSTPKQTSPDFGELTMKPGTTHTDHPGLEIRIDSLSRKGGKVKLVVVWNNRTAYDASYGVAYAIDRLDDGAWVSCAKTDDLSFIEIACQLPAGKTQNEVYDLTNTFDVSAPGTYRFSTECYVRVSNEESTRCALWAEFTMDSEPPRDDSEDANIALDFQCQYIRADNYQADAQYPQVRIIPSLQALLDYCVETSLDFSDTRDRYDEAFFEESYLIFVLVEEGSGSIRHSVKSVEQTPDKDLRISILREVPEVGTADMAQWHIFLELCRDALVETANDVWVYLDGQLAYNGDVIVPPQLQPVRKSPPAGTLFTPEGETPLLLAGYNWTHTDPDGTGVSVIADQAGRPLTADILKPVTIPFDHAETIYLPVPGSGVYEPTDSLGFLVKLDWEVTPSKVMCTCWPDTVGRNDYTSGEEIPFDLNGPFYARPGRYIYEFSATWEDTGAGYYGTANYYVYITGNP